VPAGHAGGRAVTPPAPIPIDAVPTETAPAPAPRSVLPVVAVLAALHLAVIAGALAIAAYAFGPVAELTDTGSMRFPVQFFLEIVVLLVGLVFLLTREHWFVKLIAETLIQGLFLLPVAVSLFGLAVIACPDSMSGSVIGPVSFGAAVAVTAAAALANRVIVHDAIGVLTITFITALVGVTVGVVPLMVLLGAMMVLDAIAVYLSKHMIVLVSRTAGLRLAPILIVPPTLAGLLARPNQLAEDRFRGGTGGAILGFGDFFFPVVLVVSAATFLPGLGPAVGAAIGIVAGYVALGMLLGNGRAHAGLPPLAGGALAGCVLGAVLTGVPLW